MPFYHHTFPSLRCFALLFLIPCRNQVSFLAALQPIACPPPQRLLNLFRATETIESETPILLPCCYDGLTARLIARAGFDATFLTGFGVSAVHGFPDTQLISYAEMQQTAGIVAEALSSVAHEAKMGIRPSSSSSSSSGAASMTPIPCIVDGDTGYGNSVNVKRTVFGYAQAGMAGIMIEDQIAPKRCGHVAGKSVVDMPEAIQRVKAACDARDEYEEQFGPGTGPLILARTDAAAIRGLGFDAAVERCLAFQEVGCDMTFLEAPETVEQMKEYCLRVPGPKLANMLEFGSTPILPPKELKSMGYTMAAYPLTLLSASIKAMQESLDCIKNGRSTNEFILSFANTKDVVGFTRYAEEEQRYRADIQNE